MSRRASNAQQSGYPLVNVQRFQPLKCDVSTRQLDDLATYIVYVESATGDKPTEGEVVGAALAQLFKLDRGFQKWRESSRKPDANASRSGGPTSPSKA